MSEQAPTLKTVEDVPEIRQSVTSFATGIPENQELAGSLFRQTTYWVYDPNTGCFGPGKFVGFSNMDYQIFQKARRGRTTGNSFSGGITREAIESALGTSFKETPTLTPNLVQFAESHLEPGILHGVNTSKWRFVSLIAERGIAVARTIHLDDRSSGDLTEPKRLRDHSEILEAGDITKPDKLWSRSEILKMKPCPVPAEGGVYAWYLRDFPAFIPTQDCVRHGNLTLLYVGISPSAPPKDGKKPSTQTLRHRIKFHLNGQAEGSTLRITLGCLLSEELGIQLRRVGNGRRMTFVEGEKELNEWMNENAFVCWTVHPKPWELEDELIENLSLPLNLKQNKSHPFHPILTGIRKEAKLRAKELPVIKQ